MLPENVDIRIDMKKSQRATSTLIPRYGNDPSYTLDDILRLSWLKKICEEERGETRFCLSHKAGIQRGLLRGGNMRELLDEVS